MAASPSRILSATLLLGLGCQSPPDISGEVETYAASLSGITSELCVCYLLLGYDSRDECSDAMGIVSFADQECMNRALEGHEDAAQDYLECANPVMENYFQCLQGNVDCEESPADQCQQVQASGLAVCPQLPADVLAEFSACTQ